MSHETTDQAQVFNARRTSRELRKELQSAAVGWKLDRILAEKFDDPSQRAQLVLQLLSRNPKDSVRLLAIALAEGCATCGDGDTMLMAPGLTKAQYRYWMEERSEKMNAFFALFDTRLPLMETAGSCWECLESIGKDQEKAVWMTEILRRLGHYVEVECASPSTESTKSFLELRSDLVAELGRILHQQLNPSATLVAIERLGKEAQLSSHEIKSLIDVAFAASRILQGTTVIEVITIPQPNGEHYHSN